MRRSLELLFIDPKEQAAAHSLGNKDTSAKFGTDQDRLIIVTAGKLFLDFKNGLNAIGLGPEKDFNAIRLSPGIEVLRAFDEFNTELLMIIGEANIKAALAPDGKGPWKLPEKTTKT